MKFIVTTILALALATSLSAVEPVKSVKQISKSTSQSKLASDMRAMLSAVVDMQRAGFYNNKTGVKDAAERLTQHLDTLLTTDPTTYLPDSQINAGKFAHKREKMIKMYATDLIESLDEGNMEEAMEDYGQILRQCTSCHIRIRNREWK